MRAANERRSRKGGMKETELVSRLIGDIYDAALDAARWPVVLEKVAGFVGGAASALFMKDTIRNSLISVYTWGYDPDFARLYAERYIREDPFTVGQLFFDIEQPMCLADLMAHEDFRKSRFYLEWVRPQSWIDAIGVTLEKTATAYSVISVIRHERDGIADEGALRRAKLLAPHVRRSVLIGKVIDLQRVEVASLADTLDGLATSVILVDGVGRIMHANAAGRDLLTHGTVLRLLNGKLTAIDSRADQALQEIFANANSGDAAMRGTGIAVPLTQSADRYVAHVLPLTAGARRNAGVAYSAVAAIFVHKAALELPHPVEAIAETFKLTPMEIRVLMMIVEVGGVPEIAPVLGVSETTVKTHLRHIFIKTGANRQAELVKLVASYMSPLR